MAIKSMLAGVKHNDSLTVIIEVIDSDKVDMVGEMGSQETFEVRVVSPARLCQNLMAQATLAPEMIDIFSDLLSFAPDTCEIYKFEVPKTFIGRTRNEFFTWLLNLRSEGIHITPIGIFRGKKIYLNSKEENIHILKKGDRFFSICYSEGDLRKLDKHLP